MSSLSNRFDVDGGRSPRSNVRLFGSPSPWAIDDGDAASVASTRSPLAAPAAPAVPAAPAAPAPPAAPRTQCEATEELPLAAEVAALSAASEEAAFDAEDVPPPSFPPAEQCFRLVRYRDPFAVGSAERAQLIAMYRVAFAEELAYMASQGRATTASLGFEEAFSWVFGGKTLYVARCVGIAGDTIDEIAAFATCEQRYTHNPLFVRGLVTSLSFRRRGLGRLVLNYVVSLPASEHVIEYWKGRPVWLESFYNLFGFRYTGAPSSAGPAYRQLLRRGKRAT